MLNDARELGLEQGLKQGLEQGIIIKEKYFFRRY